MKFLLSLQSELLKTRRSAALNLTIIAAAVGPLIFLLNVMLDEDEIDVSAADLFHKLYKTLFEINGAAIFPLFIILISSFLVQLEYRNNTWKQVFTSPQLKLHVFLSKFFTLQLFMLSFLILAPVFMLLSILAIHFLMPEANVFDHPLNVSMLFYHTASTYLLSLAISSIQFWLALQFSNFIIPVGIGFILWLSGTLLTQQNYSHIALYFPYSLHAFPVSATLATYLRQAFWISLGFTGVFLVVGKAAFNRIRLIK